jgi:hypothetical protein
MLEFKKPTYEAVKMVLESKELITDETVNRILLTSGIDHNTDNYESISFMLKRFLFSARITGIYSFLDDDPAIILIIEMISPSYK